LTNFEPSHHSIGAGRALLQEEVLRASNLGAPITICGRQSAPARAYTIDVAAFVGNIKQGLPIISPLASRAARIAP
jgi:hypothetical protein